jgi:chromosome segregation ATPase
MTAPAAAAALFCCIQVAYHCSEQGRVLDGLRERYAELANALFLGLSSLTQHNAAVSAALQGATAAAAADRALIRSLQRQLADTTADADELRSELGASQAKLAQLEAESAEALKQALQNNSNLKGQLWQCREELQAAQAAADRAAEAAQAELEAQAAAAEEARHDMLQRLGFLNAQLMALR